MTPPETQVDPLLARAARALETLLAGIDAVHNCTDTATQRDLEQLLECAQRYESLIAELREAAS